MVERANGPAGASFDKLRMKREIGNKMGRKELVRMSGVKAVMA